MKILFTTIIVIFFFGCTKEKIEVELDAAISITQTEEGYNIYSNKGELILEFTEQNTDSLSLETLEYIYQTAKEFYDREPYDEENENKSVNYSRVINE